MTHTCRNAHRCRQAIRTEDGERIGALTERPQTLCPPCEERAFAAIRQLAGDWQALSTAAGELPNRGHTGPRVTRTPDRHIAPVRVDTIDIARDIDAELRRWATVLNRGERKQAPRTIAERVAQNATVIAARLGTLIDMPACGELDGVDGVLRLERLHRAANRALGIGRVVTWLRDPCTNCGRRTLASDPEEARVTCAHCDRSWASDEFDRINPLETAA